MIEEYESGEKNSVTERSPETAVKDGERFRIYDAEHTFLAVYEWREDKHCLWPVKMFL